MTKFLPDEDGGITNSAEHLVRHSYEQGEVAPVYPLQRKFQLEKCSIPPESGIAFDDVSINIGCRRHPGYGKTLPILIEHVFWKN